MSNCCHHCDDRRELDRRRVDAIETISCLWPPDSEYSETAAEGRQYLLDALAVEWRSLPVPVLEYMARRQAAREAR
ncbi:MAG: hypothetical protein AMJ84_00025 [Acidithiobacillales bacterium SM23_46]|nr:MAG: hypothetical protein AMJ84_00025 [Acidithiobacillales bacterium SM23_46]KPL28994.1 MAG: hypothetical protein AMJ72_00090 [Acidithiobacillales bacterium SM1_46]